MNDETTERLTAIGLRCSERERAAMKAERDVDAFFGALFLKDRVGDRFVGVIASVVEFGLFVELQGVFVEGLVKSEDLGHVHFDPDTQTLATHAGKTWSVGDAVEVEVRSVNLDRRQVDLALLEEGKEMGDGTVRRRSLSEAVDLWKAKGKRLKRDPRRGAALRAGHPGGRSEETKAGKGEEGREAILVEPGTARVRRGFREAAGQRDSGRRSTLGVFPREPGSCCSSHSEQGHPALALSGIRGSPRSARSWPLCSDPAGRPDGTWVSTSCSFCGAFRRPDRSPPGPLGGFPERSRLRPATSRSTGSLMRISPVPAQSIVARVIGHRPRGPGREPRRGMPALDPTLLAALELAPDCQRTPRVGWLSERASSSSSARAKSMARACATAALFLNRAVERSC